MNKRQKKKAFKKLTGKNPQKELTKEILTFLIWVLHPNRRSALDAVVRKYNSEKQQIRNLENFNRIMAERRNACRKQKWTRS